MRVRHLLSAFLLFLAVGVSPLAAAVDLPPGDREPLLRVDAGGPTSYVTALAFSPDGKTLYAAGWDKVVRVWTVNNQGRFVPDRVPAYRVPIGPGLDGAINALALSEDGVWLAVAGEGVARRLAGFRQTGLVVPASGALTPAMRLDQGLIYVFNTRDRSVRLLRGHLGPVLTLAFAPPHPAKPPLLLSVARERGEGPNQWHTAARLWDVARGESVAQQENLRDTSARPGVSVWHVGRRLNQVRAALALDDGILRIWDAWREGQAVSEARDTRYNLTVARLPDQDRLLTAGYGRGQARLKLWQVPEEGGPTVARQTPASTPVDSFPRALGLLSRTGNGQPDLAAVLLRVPGRGEEYRLQLVDLAPDHLGEVVADQVLWRGSARQPALATALKGQYLAVAGNQDHEIRIYSLRSLLRKDGAGPQTLRGAGLAFRHASFVSKGTDVGLLLNPRSRKKPGAAPPSPDKGEGDWVFDFSKGRLTGNLDGWKRSAPALGSWRAEHAGGPDGPSISVYQGEQLVRRIDLGKGLELSDYALLRPAGDRAIPLLAVAAHELGQPSLVLYNARTGEPLRHYTGHTERLEALAFSGDGRLLVSAAQDQTVRVWSLTDLDQVLGRHGLLPGVAVHQRGNSLEVGQVKSDSPARGKLHSGDVIAGLVEKGKLQPLESPRAFYEALWGMRPGQELTIRRGAPDGADDVTLTVGQGIDDQKPLLSLFVTRAARVEDCDWIGWNPVGPYESSSPRAERYLGWHFNTGDPRVPTRFARADQHRKDYYREGLLQRLVRQGTLGHVEAPRLSAPWIGLWVKEGGEHRQPEAQTPLLVRHPHVSLEMEVRNRPLASLSALTWQLDGGPENQLARDGPEGEILSASLDLGRGDHTIQVTAWTNDVPPQPTRQVLALCYQPPPPRIQYLGGANRPLMVKDRNFDLAALVSPGLAGEDVQVTVRQRHGSREVQATTETYRAERDQPVRVERRLELRPGSNLLDVVAVNRGAPRGQEEAETGRLQLEVFYTHKAPPPLISVTGVVPLSASGGEGEPLKTEPSEPLVVHVPTIAISGTIKASEELAEAERDQGDPARAIRLTRFEPGKQQEFSFRERITLQPGTQSLSFRARTESSDVAERVLTVVYRPALPAISLTEPGRGETFYGDTDTAVIRLRARLSRPEERRPYRAVVLVNDKETATSPIIDQKAGTLTAEVPVPPGESRLQVRLSNAWGMVSVSEPAWIMYLRPPQIRRLKQTREGDEPALNLEAEVDSPTPLLQDSVRAEVNGQESPAAQVVLKDRGAGRWTVQLRGVLLEAGSRENRVALQVSNTEAECREPATLTVETEKVLPPPLVEFLQPRANQSVSTPRVRVRFHARSVRPFLQVQLVREGRLPLTVNLRQVRRDVEGNYELIAEPEIDLKRGLNNLRLRAVNASGMRATPPLVINYVPPPFQVVIDSLIAVAPGARPVTPKREPRGGLSFPEIEHGRVRLHGRILWGDESPGRRREDLVMRVFVNGFQQLPIRLRPRAGQSLETPFEAELLLSRERENHVSLSVPGEDAGDSSEFLVDCREPVAQQRLHLLLLSPRGDPVDIRKQILQAVQSRREGDTLEAPAFDRVRMYPPLTGSRVRPVYIYTQLSTIKATILDLARQGRPMNDVVMIYYQGGEELTAKGNFYETHAGPGGPARQFGIPCDRLAEFLAEIPGAQMLLLDVQRQPAEEPAPTGAVRDKIVRWEDDYPEDRSHVVVLRYAWQGKEGWKRDRLLTVLEKAVPRAGRLRQVVALMGEMMASSRSPDLLVSTYLPSDLQDLLVGRAR